MADGEVNNDPKILVFSTDKISDPAIDMAGLLKLHYPPTVYTIPVPCSSAIKPRWILYALEQGFDGARPIAIDYHGLRLGEEFLRTAQIYRGS